jgi:hypothetical protein
MELKEFIEETLVQIVEGVKSAQVKTKDSGVVIVPSGIRRTVTDVYKKEGSTELAVYHIDFEVVLTATKGVENKSGIGVFFANIGVGVNEKADTNNVSATSIKFSIPIILPSVH